MTTHFVTLGQAAKLTGKPKSTLSHDIKTGRLSVAEKTSSGYRIDPAELSRLYTVNPVQDQSSRTILNPVQGTVPNPSEIVQLDSSKQLAEQYEKRIQELMQALEREKENHDFLKRQLERSTLLLEHHKPASAPSIIPESSGKRGFWGLFKRS
jgi:hypothetical protein